MCGPTLQHGLHVRFVCTRPPTTSWFACHGEPSHGSEVSSESQGLIRFLSHGRWRGMSCLTALAIITARKLVLGQSELRISIRGGGIGVLFCNLASQPAVLLTGRGERYCHWWKKTSFQNIFSSWLEVRWETVFSQFLWSMLIVGLLCSFVKFREVFTCSLILFFFLWTWLCSSQGYIWTRSSAIKYNFYNRS